MSNFVFSRRALQRAINRLANVLCREQLSSLVERLNRAGDQRLPAMWECIMLDVLAAEGTLRHEVTLANGRQPDFELEVVDSEDHTLLAIGDIATVSDAGLNEQNPVDILSNELTRLAFKYGLKPNHFGYKVRGERRGPYGNARVKLFLPSSKDLLDVVKRNVEPWIKALAASRPPTESLEYSHGETEFSLTYDTSQPFLSGNILSYKVAASRSKNPLFRALKAKVDQLRAAPPGAIRLLIACDGDCALLHQSSSMYAPGTFDSRQVALDFLRQNSTVDFVLLVTVVEQNIGFGVGHTYQTKFDLVVAPKDARSERATDTVIARVEALLNRVVARIPRPIRTSYNALSRCRMPGPGPDMIGGYRVAGNRISISSRALQRLLAGVITQDEFLKAHEWNEEHANPFQRMSLKGHMIRSV